jgi:AraC-like DNA-binding protein
MSKLYFGADLPVFGPAFAIRGVGVDEPMAPSIIDRPGGTDAWLLVLFHDEAVVRLAGGQERLSAGTAVCWAPKRPHFFGNAEAPWRHSWLHVCGRRVDRLFEAGGLPRDAPFAMERSACVPHLERIYRELLDHRTADTRILEALVQVVVWEGERAALLGAGSGLPPKWRELRQFVTAHLDAPLSVPVLAKRIGMSPSHFAAEFRRRFGDTPQRMIERARLDQAAHLLADRNLRIAEVARLVGYDDPLYFSKRFRRARGRSPRDWRGAAGNPVRAEDEGPGRA